MDLPGYGYAQIGKKEREKLEKMIKSYVLSRNELDNLFVLVDSRLEPQKIDLEFIEFLGINGVPFSIVFTKCDKQNKTKTAASVEAYKNVLSETWEELPPIFITSAESGDGCDEVLDYIESINQSIAQ